MMHPSNKMRHDRARPAVFICGLEQRTVPCQMWTGIREQINPAILAVATLLTVFPCCLC